ncbi:MAG: hypothetical protein ACK4WM_09195 [Thermoflexales bacterium]
MNDMLLWNIILTGIMGLIAFVAKDKFNKLERFTEQLQQTREQIAREHITRAELETAMQRLLGQFERALDRMETKLEVLHKEMRQEKP